MVVNNLETDLPVIGDYLRQRQPKSILGLPIISQGQLAGILYLRHRTIAGIFTQDRLTAIDFLCTQAAISLENARLYQQSQSYAQKLEEFLGKYKPMKPASTIWQVIFRGWCTNFGLGLIPFHQVPDINRDFRRGARPCAPTKLEIISIALFVKWYNVISAQKFG